MPRVGSNYHTVSHTLLLVMLDSVRFLLLSPTRHVLQEVSWGLKRNCWRCCVHFWRVSLTEGILLTGQKSRKVGCGKLCMVVLMSLPTCVASPSSSPHPLAYLPLLVTHHSPVLPRPTLTEYLDTVLIDELTAPVPHNLFYINS